MPVGASLGRAVPATTMVALALVGVLGPFGTDISLPALPSIAADLGVSEGSVRLTLSAFTIGVAVGQLVIGSLSDRFGRRRLMSWGALAAAVAAFSASTAPSLPLLIAACGVLGLGSAAGLVTGRAFISDKAVGREATRQFSLLQMAVSCGPIVGPLAGALLLTVGDWRSLFLALAAFAVVGAVATIMFVPESLPPENRRPESVLGVIRTMSRILRTPQYIAFAASLWFSFGMLFSYISTSPFIFQSGLHQSSSVFALDFALNGAGLVTASLLAARLSHRVTASRLVLAGLAIQAVALLGLATVMVLGAATVWSVGACLFATTTSMGFILGPATSIALAPVRQTSGTALALLGSIQFLAAGLGSSLTAAISPDPLLGFAIVGSACTALSLTTALLGSRLPAAHDPLESS